MDAIGVTRRRHFVLNRADAKVGISPADAAEAVGWPIVAMIPSTREIPLSMNVGTPVVKLEPRSGVAKQLRQLSQLFVSTVDAEKPRRRLFRRSR
jgi:pilus assembly protein CpaE